MGALTGDPSSVTLNVYTGDAVAGDPVAVTVTKTLGVWSATLAELTEGKYTLQAVAVDDVGNSRTSTAVTFNVDTTLPTASIESSRGANTKEQTATFTVSPSDPDLAGPPTPSGVSLVECRLDGTAADYVDCTSSLSATYGSGTPLTEASHVFWTRVTDAAGNVFETSYTMVVDLTPPTASIASNRGARTKQTSATFTVTRSDPDPAGAAVPAPRALRARPVGRAPKAPSPGRRSPTGPAATAAPEMATPVLVVLVVLVLDRQQGTVPTVVIVSPQAAEVLAVLSPLVVLVVQKVLVALLLLMDLLDL